MTQEFLKVGTILKPVGLNGDVKVFSTTNFKEIRYKKGNTLYLFVDNNYVPIKVSYYRQKDSTTDILHFENINSIDEVEKLYKIDLFCIKDRSILKNDEYFYSDLINLEVYDLNQNKIVGKVYSVEEFPAQITLKVKKNEVLEGFFYIPFIDVFVKNVDLEKKYIQVKLIEGMYEN